VRDISGLMTADWFTPFILTVERCTVKLEFHDADTDCDTDILARILADTSDTRDFLKLFLRQAERHADILATIFARMSGVGVGVVECQLKPTTGRRYI